MVFKFFYWAILLSVDEGRGKSEKRGTGRRNIFLMQKPDVTVRDGTGKLGGVNSFFEIS